MAFFVSVSTGTRSGRSTGPPVHRSGRSTPFPRRWYGRERHRGLPGTRRRAPGRSRSTRRRTSPNREESPPARDHPPEERGPSRWWRWTWPAPKASLLAAASSSYYRHRRGGPGPGATGLPSERGGPVERGALTVDRLVGVSRPSRSPRWPAGGCTAYSHGVLHRTRGPGSKVLAEGIDQYRPWCSVTPPKRGHSDHRAER